LTSKSLKKLKKPPFLRKNRKKGGFYFTTISCGKLKNILQNIVKTIDFNVRVWYIKTTTRFKE